MPIWEDHRVIDRVGQFQRDGATVLRNVVDAQWLDLLAEGVEYNRTHPSEWSHWYTSPDEAVGFWSDYVTWPQVEQYRRVVFESGLADIAGRLMDSATVRFFHEHVLVKEPGASEATPWHHDDPYYGIDGMQNVSMWIALDPVPATSGLQFIAGSHLWGRRFVPRKFIDHSPYGAADDRFELLPSEAELARRPRRARLGRRAGRRARVPLPDFARGTGQRSLDTAPCRQPALARRRRSFRCPPVDHLAAVRTERAPAG